MPMTTREGVRGFHRPPGQAIGRDTPDILRDVTTAVRGAPYAGWRALAATVLVMSGAVAAHTWAGGHVPDGSAVIALTALVLGGSVLVLRGTVSALVLLPVVAAAQAGLHTSFAMSTTDHAGHLDHAEASATWSWEMLLAHAAVTALTAVVWHLCARASVGVVTVLRVAPALVTRRPIHPAVTRVPHVQAHLVLLLAAPRRGPPVATRA